MAEARDDGSSGASVSRAAEASRGAGEEAISVVRYGTGPEVLLVHGGASPATTWRGLEVLRTRWTLAVAHRRGFPPSPPPPNGRRDFQVDAADVARLLDERPHVVAHSYGAVGVALAAACRPTQPRSITFIEPAIFIPADDPDVAALRAMGEAVLARGLEADPVILRRFLRLAGAPVTAGEPLPREVVAAVRRTHGTRPPGEADLDLDAIPAAGMPILIASGGHFPTMERMCDALAEALGARRLVAPGAGHFVPSAPGFAQGLDAFLTDASAAC